MGKQTALGDYLFVGQYDLSGDIGALSTISGSRAIIDVSAINTTGYERLLGRSDGQINFAAYYNPAAGQSHPVLSAIGTAAGTANTIVSYLHGAAVGNDMASLYAEQIDYAVTVGADLSIALAVNSQASNGPPLEWGQMLTAGSQTFASSGTVATIVDGQTFTGGTATAFGAAAYLHALSIASGTATVAVQDSANGTSGWANVTGLVFSDVSAAGFERVATGATAAVRRFWRVNVTGTFTNLVAAVNAVVYAGPQT